MCGIIGFSGKNVTQEHIRVLQKVMIESRIRGMHASGIAWCDNRGNILSVVEPIPIDKLVGKFNWSVFFPKGEIAEEVIAEEVAEEVHLIAHARYSTSDIRFNQPIVGESMAISMNGVITQSEPNIWEKQYGYKCVTKNDSELLLRALEAGDNPWKVFSKSSIAYVSLSNNGEIEYGRNGLRPLWAGKIGESIICASTYDILKRAGVKNISKVNTENPFIELQRRSNNERTIKTLE